jgi:diguanylate cyclase (GGDEF)-like protein
MALSWLSDPESSGPRWNRQLPLIAALASTALAALVALTAIQLSQAQSQSALRTQAQAELERLRSQLDRELQSVLSVPETVAAFVAAEGSIDEEVFAAVVARLTENNGNIRNVALAPNSVITSVYPRQGNEAAIGLRYLEHPVQAEAVRRAISGRRTVVAGPIKLVQGGNGIVSRTPVFLGKREGSPYWGIVAIAVNADAIFTRVGFDGSGNGIDVAAREVDTAGAVGPAFVGKAGVFDRDPILMQYVLPGGGIWQLGAATASGWGRNNQQLAVIAAVTALLGLAVGVLTYRLVASRQLMRRLALRDALTGLPYRSLCEDRLKQAMVAARSHGRVGALILLELDEFATVRERVGRRASDAVLMRVASRVADRVRTLGSVARVGSERFAIVVPELPPGLDLPALIQHIQQTVGEPIALPGRSPVRVTASVGFARFGAEPGDLPALVERAAQSMTGQQAAASPPAATT